MANHTITLTVNEETLYGRYLVLIAKTDDQMMTAMKESLVEQVKQTINEKGREKFDGLTVATKLAFLDS